MSIEFEMPPDIVSDHWSEVARERIRSEKNEPRSQGFFTGIPMNLISYEAKSRVRDRICALSRILDLRRWSGKGHYLHRGGL